MKLQWVAIFSILQVVKGSVQNCCDGENTLVARSCMEGSLNDVLDCPRRFLIGSEEVDSIDEINGELKFGRLVKDSNSFCRANFNDTKVFIVCFTPDDIEEPSNTLVFLGFASSVFLILTAVVYVSLPKLLDLQGLCVVHSVLGLAFVFIIMGVNRLRDADSSDFICHFYGYSLYFCFLYAFFWLNAYSFHLWRTTRQPNILSNAKDWKSISYIYSCGFPLILLLVVVFSQYSDLYIYTHPRMAEESICWFGTIEATFVYMYVPISVLLILNIIFFSLTTCTLWKEIRQHDGNKKMKILRYRLSLCFKMFFVMGLSWIFEVLSAALEHNYPSVLWRVTDTINSLQGVSIFIIMVVLRKRVYRLLAGKSYGSCLPSTWRSIEDDEEEEGCSDVNDLKLESVNEK